METLQIISIIITLILGFYSLGKILKAWLRNFERKIEERYKEETSDKNLHESVKRIEKRLEELDANADGTLALLRYRLKEEISLAISRGYTTAIEYEVLADMYNAYKNMGGNHTVSHMFEDYDELDIRKGEK